MAFQNEVIGVLWSYDACIINAAQDGYRNKDGSCNPQTI